MEINKNMTVINVALPADVLSDMDAVIAITGRSASDMISAELREYFVHFQNNDGEIKPRPAVLLTGVTEYERKVAEVEGREVREEESPCVVLSDRSMTGSPYYRIWSEKYKNIMSVPADAVRFPESQAEQAV